MNTGIQVVISRRLQYLILCCVLFLFGLGVQFYSTLALLLYILVFTNVEKHMDFDMALLLSFLLTYLFIDWEGQLGGLFEKFRFLGASAGAYLIGREIFSTGRDVGGMKVLPLLLILLGSGLNGVFSFVHTMRNYPELIFSRQYVDFFLKGDEPTHALAFSALFTGSIALTPLLIYWLIASRKKIETSALAVMFLVVCSGLFGLYASNIFQNRTPFATLAAGVFVPFIFAPRVERSRYGVYLLGLSLLIASAYLYYADALRLLESGVLARPSEEVLTLTGRTGHWSEGLVRIAQNPFGHKYMVEGHAYWFHNHWLDVARVSGFMPLIAIVVFEFRHVMAAVRGDMFLSGLDRSIILVCLTVILIVFMTGPFPEGGPQLFFFFLVVLGFLKNSCRTKDLSGKSFSNECDLYANAS